MNIDAPVDAPASIWVQSCRASTQTLTTPPHVQASALLSGAWPRCCAQSSPGPAHDPMTPPRPRPTCKLVRCCRALGRAAVLNELPCHPLRLCWVVGGRIPRPAPARRAACVGEQQGWAPPPQHPHPHTTPSPAHECKQAGAEQCPFCGTGPWRGGLDCRVM